LKIQANLVKFKKKTISKMLKRKYFSEVSIALQMIILIICRLFVSARKEPMALLDRPDQTNYPVAFGRVLTPTPVTTQSSVAGAAHVECGSTHKVVDECFKNLPPHLVEFLQTSKVPLNQEDVTNKCK